MDPANHHLFASSTPSGIGRSGGGLAMGRHNVPFQSALNQQGRGGILPQSPDPNHRRLANLNSSSARPPTGSGDEDFARQLSWKLRSEAGPVDSPAIAPAGFPSLVISVSGIISVLLSPDVVVEISVDRTIRVTCMGKFSATMTADNRKCALSHEFGFVSQDDRVVSSTFTAGPVEKCFRFVDAGILFDMASLPDSYIITSRPDPVLGNSAAGIYPLPRCPLATPKRDHTLQLFYGTSYHGKRYVDLCHELVSHAHFSSADGELVVVVNGVHIRVDRSSNVEISTKPRIIRFTPVTGAVQMRSSTIDLAIDHEGRGYVTQGNRRVHVSGCGIVVANEAHVTSMDHAGHVISSV